MSQDWGWEGMEEGYRRLKHNDQGKKGETKKIMRYSPLKESYTEFGREFGRKR